jgi:hypothetical protein
LKAQHIAAFQMHLGEQIPQIRLKPEDELHFPTYHSRDITQQIIYDFENAMYSVPKKIPKGEGYLAPQLLNLDAMDFDSQKHESANQVLWDVSVEMIEEKPSAKTGSSSEILNTSLNGTSSRTPVPVATIPIVETYLPPKSSFVPNTLTDNPW